LPKKTDNESYRRYLCPNESPYSDAPPSPLIPKPSDIKKPARGRFLSSSLRLTFLVLLLNV